MAVSEMRHFVKGDVIMHEKGNAGRILNQVRSVDETNIHRIIFYC